LAQVELMAEEMDHHPESFNVYDRVGITPTTRDAGGVTNPPMPSSPGSRPADSRKPGWSGSTHDKAARRSTFVDVTNTVLSTCAVGDAPREAPDAAATGISAWSRRSTSNRAFHAARTSSRH
jgi:hypothetical protein